jgi:hypothetical protein
VYSMQRNGYNSGESEIDKSELLVPQEKDINI